MKRRVFAGCILIYAAKALAAPDAGWLETPVPRRPEAQEIDITAGKRLYGIRCSFCHGRQGDGRGVVAPYLDPAPRDFTGGLFKFRTTASGELPTDEDLYRTITRGIPGTAMPAWSIFSEQERWNLVGYIKTFAEDFTDPGFSPYRQPDADEKIIFEFASAPAATPEVLAEGQKVFQQAKCWECHGRQGRGDGSDIAGFKTDLGHRIWPRDLTRPWRYRGGQTVRDIFRTLTTGLAGTPMPSYAGTLVPGKPTQDEQSRWTLACYVYSLQRPPRQGTVLKVRRVSPLPQGPDDAGWEQAEELDVPLFPQVIRPPRWQAPAVDLVRVRALYDEERIAFRLEYSDRKANREHRPEDEPPAPDGSYPRIDLSSFFRGQLGDRVALQFPARLPRGPERPHFLYGQPGQAVCLWRYHAERDGQREHPSPVEELIAQGPDRITLQGADDQDVTGRGVHADGQWRVVLSRKLKTGHPHDLPFQPGVMIPFSVMAWDGAFGEHGLRQSLSSWYHLDLAAPIPLRTYLVALIAALFVAALEIYLLVKVGRSKQEVER